MQRDRLTGTAAIALGVGMAVNAILGPLVAGVIRIRESAGMETQLLGGEIVTLCVAAPLAIVGGAAWWRGHRAAPMLTAGPAGYALYGYVQFVLVPDYTRYAGNNEYFFPLYLALVILAWALLVRSWRTLVAAERVEIPPHFATALGWSLIALNGLFALAWIASIAAAWLRPPTAEYLAHPTAFWLVRLMDLGFVIPIALLTGIALLRHTPLAAIRARAFVGVQLLLAWAVAAMAIRMQLAHDPDANSVLLVTTVVASLVFTFFYGRLIQSSTQS